MITILIITIIITGYFLLQNKTWVIGIKKKFDLRACETLLTQSRKKNVSRIANFTTVSNF